MTKIDIGTADGKKLRLDLPTLVDTRALIQANSGGGKSWWLRLLVERAARHVQVIILDPEGEFATLREKVDLALVGQGGEMATDVRSAGLLARKLVEVRVPAIVDLYDLRLDQRRAYVRQFLEALMAVPRAHWHQLLVIIDEAHLFAPERAAGEAESTAAVVALMSQGRKRGFAGIISTQRLSKLHKDVAAECNNVVIGRTWLDTDQVRAGDLLGMSKTDRQALRDLAPGEFFAFGPAFVANGVVRFHSDQVATTHPKTGERHKLEVPKPSAAIQEVVSQIGDLPAQAEQEAKDLAAAQRRVRELEQQLRARPVQQPLPAPEPVRVEIPVFKDGEVSRLEAVVEQLGDVAQTLSAASQGLGVVATRLREPMVEIESAISAVVSRQTPLAQLKAAASKLDQSGPVRAAAAPSRPTAQPPASVPAGDPVGAGRDGLPRGERLILEALIQYPAGLRREQLTVLTSYKRSSRDTYLQRLREKGLVSTDGDKVTATDAGVAALPDARPLPTGRALQEFWLGQLPQGERAILEVLLRAYPSAIDREALSEATGYKRSSRDTYLQRMAAKELVETAGTGQVRASATLFEG